MSSKIINLPLARRTARVADKLINKASGARRTIRRMATVDKFAAVGSNLSYDPDGTYSYPTIYLGDNVVLGTGATLVATRSIIRIGNDVMFGPGVTIRGGNHRYDIVGIPTRWVTDDRKRPEDDRDVIIEDDVWVGERAMIMHGVTIGRGSIIGAGSIVTRSVPRYSIAVGNPARVLRPRFTPEEILRHEAILSTRQSPTG